MRIVSISKHASYFFKKNPITTVSRRVTLAHEMRLSTRFGRTTFKPYWLLVRNACFEFPDDLPVKKVIMQ